MSVLTEDIGSRVRIKAQQGAFLGQLLSISKGRSDDIHEDFIRQLTALAVQLRHIFEGEGLVHRFPSRNSIVFWQEVAGRQVAFVDGGVARIELPSAAPMGIRVGAYSVRIGDQTEDREDFSTTLTLVDELYSAESWTFDDVFDDTQKMTDAARIIGEASSGFALARKNPHLSAVLLHGPLVNPVAPYGTDGFPHFSMEAARLLYGDPDRIFSDDERHFVVLYRLILEELRKRDVPVLGVVERSISRHPSVTFSMLDLMQEKGTLSPDDAQAIRTRLADYRINDSALFGVMLNAGEYCEPVLIDRQQPANKWPANWYSQIKAYPRALSTYIKSSDQSDPFRVEMLEGKSAPAWIFELIYQTAKLLPSYGFPVGLDIVDKFAKVPSWMTQGVRKEHAINLLNKALKTGEPRAVEYAKKVLTARGRDWLFRPKS